MPSAEDPLELGFIAQDARVRLVAVLRPLLAVSEAFAQAKRPSC